MEDLVSYEVAKLAHKLGFGEKVLYGIKETGEHFAGKSAYDWNGDRTTTCYSCPSHSHLYKWIMKHGIYIDVETIISRGKVAFKVVIQYGPCLKCVKVLPKNYECYDKAWDAGLLYALELICEGHIKCCKHDDCCDEHEHHDHEKDCCEKEHEHCEHEHEHCHEHKDECEHDHKHDECEKEECEEHCKHEHHEHHEHHSFEITPEGIKDEDSRDDESDKQEHDKKPGKGK